MTNRFLIVLLSVMCLNQSAKGQFSQTVTCTRTPSTGLTYNALFGGTGLTPIVNPGPGVSFQVCPDPSTQPLDILSNLFVVPGAFNINVSAPDINGCILYLVTMNNPGVATLIYTFVAGCDAILSSQPGIDLRLSAAADGTQQLSYHLRESTELQHLQLLAIDPNAQAPDAPLRSWGHPATTGHLPLHGLALTPHTPYYLRMEGTTADGHTVTSNVLMAMYVPDAQQRISNDAATGHYQLAWPVAHTVRDVQGRELFRGQGRTIDLSAYPTGLYLLHTANGPSFKLLR